LRCAPASGEVLIADRGYARPRKLRTCLDLSGAAARDSIARVGWKAVARRDQASGHTRSPQPGGGRVHGIAHLAAVRDTSRRDLRSLPPEMADQAGIQANEIAAPYRSIIHPHRGRQPQLAVRPPDPRAADRRHWSGVPGSFPLWSWLPPAAARCGGLSSLCSTHSATHWVISACVPSSTPIRACTNSSLTPNDVEHDKGLLPSGPYPDACGAYPAMTVGAWCSTATFPRVGLSRSFDHASASRSCAYSALALRGPGWCWRRLPTRQGSGVPRPPSRDPLTARYSPADSRAGR